MKKYSYIFLFSGLLAGITGLEVYAVSQQYDSVLFELEKDSNYINRQEIKHEWQIDEIDSAAISEANKEIKADTTFFTLGNKRIRIIEEGDETNVKIEKDGKDITFGDTDSHERFFEEKKMEDWQNFKVHWAGFEFGLNNYTDKDHSFARTPENAFMDLNNSKSWNFNLNFAQYSMGFGSDRVGIGTGMGIEWSNYHFSDTNNIQKSNGQIEIRDIPENTARNKMQTTYLTIPLLIELQSAANSRNDRAYLSVGVIGGIKLFANTKLKYYENGEKSKDKRKGDYYLSSLRYALTARAGYKAIKLYCNYYMSSLFIKDRGPELYPIAAGLVVSF